MMSDLLLAAVAMIVWSRTAPDSMVHGFMLNLAFVGSVSSLVFNANPLMRFDGYYILTDLIGQPNLYQLPRETLLRLMRRWLFGMRDEPVLTVWRGDGGALRVRCVRRDISRAHPDRHHRADRDAMVRAGDSAGVCRGHRVRGGSGRAVVCVPG